MEIPNETLVALAPQDMVPAQQALTAWCDRKIAAVKAELADLTANLELATEKGWKHASVANSINRTARRVTYYEKLKAAVDAGYVIVPNFPIDVFAVRVQRDKQPETARANRWGGFDAKPQLLPAGDGRYVDDKLFSRDESFIDDSVKDKPRTIQRYVSDDYNDVDFPVVAVKPAVLNATQRAMALRIFDQMGMVQNQAGRDPIVVGQILDPRGNRRRVTFFVAWWLDTVSL